MDCVDYLTATIAVFLLSSAILPSNQRPEFQIFIPLRAVVDCLRASRQSLRNFRSRQLFHHVEKRLSIWKKGLTGEQATDLNWGDQIPSNRINS
jgi:hypothetical protein